MKKLVLLLFVCLALSVSQAQQVADPNFETKVAHPAYTKNGPKVLFDEAHNNFHTAGGRYKPFADLITSDGYQVTPNKEKFSAQVLKGFNILVISNALGAAQMNMPEAANPGVHRCRMRRGAGLGETWRCAAFDCRSLRRWDRQIRFSVIVLA
jgi:hypothetical protein